MGLAGTEFGRFVEMAAKCGPWHDTYIDNTLPALWGHKDNDPDKAVKTLDQALAAVNAAQLDKALAAIESLESAEFDAQGEPVNLDQQYSEQLLEDIRNALKAKSLDELPPSLQELVRREQQQQSGQTDAKSGARASRIRTGQTKDTARSRLRQSNSAGCRVIRPSGSRLCRN